MTTVPGLRPATCLFRLLLATLGFFLLVANTYATPVSLVNSDQSITQLPTTAERIISLSPHITELIFAAGAGSKLVAVVTWSDYPPAAQTIQQIGDAFRVDLELLMKLKPDLVVGWQSGNLAAMLDKIEKLGIPVWRTEISQLQEVGEIILAIGKAAGTEQAAAVAAATFNRQTIQLRQRFENAPPFRYFMQLYPQPLYTVNSEHLISQGLELCQGENVFARLSKLAPTVSQEAVIASQPDTIFYTNNTDNTPIDAPIKQWTPWLGASAKPRMLALNPDLISRPGPRIIDGIRQACEAQNTP